MEHYNLLYVEEGPSGLYVLRTSEEDSLVQRLSTSPHQNIGDFYSNVPSEELADRISQILQKASLSMEIVVVNQGSFDESKADLQKEYIIKEKAGVRIYLPGAGGTNQHKQELYQDRSMDFLEALFSDEKEGSLQIEFKELVECFTEANVRLEELTREIKKGIKELTDELIVAEVLRRPKTGKQVLN